MPKQIIVVDFDEVFHYAKEKHNIEWNKCCDIFHRGSILCTDEGKDLSVYLSDLEYSLEYDELPKNKLKYSEDKKLGIKILIEFMKKHNLEEAYIRNDF